MIGAVDQCGFDINYRVTANDTVLQGVSDPLLNGRDVLPGYGTSHYLIFEYEAGAALQRLYFQPYMAVLATAPGLAHEAALSPHGSCNSLAIGDPGFAYIGLNAEFTFQPLYQHL